MADDFIGGVIAAIIGFFFGNKYKKVAERKNRKIKAAEEFRVVIESDFNKVSLHGDSLDKVYGSAAGRHKEANNKLLNYLGIWEKIWFKKAWSKCYGNPEYNSLSLKQYMDGGSPMKRKKILSVLERRVKRLLKYVPVH